MEHGSGASEGPSSSSSSSSAAADRSDSSRRLARPFAASLPYARSFLFKEGAAPDRGDVQSALSEIEVSPKEASKTYLMRDKRKGKNEPSENELCE